MEKTVLVTGGAGYIGSHVALELSRSGYSPIVLDDLSTGSYSNIPKGVQFYHGDVGSPELVARVLAGHEIRSVMHIAGSIIVSDSIARPIEYYRNNTRNALELAAQCIKGGVAHFIFSSTAAVYGVVDTLGPVAESTPPRPISPYGASKLMTEMMLRDISAAHPSMQALSLRYFNVAGADPKGRTGQGAAVPTHLIRSAIDTYLGLRPHLDIYGADYETRDGTCERDFIHVADLAAAHVAALRYLEAGGASTAINCGYGRGATVREVIAALEALTGSKLPVRTVGRRPGDAPRVVACHRCSFKHLPPKMQIYRLTNSQICSVEIQFYRRSSQPHHFML
jgi:UDP-glucose 4-epimerase